MDLIVAMYKKLIEMEEDGMARPELIQDLKRKLKEAEDEI